MTPDAHRHGHKFPAERAHILEAPDRALTQPAREVLLAAGVQPGMVVVDVGAGTGYFAREAARLVAPGGRIVGLDVNAQMVARARELAQGLPGIEFLSSHENELPIESSSADLVFMGNVLHELDGDGTLLEAKRVLRKNGCVAVLEWKAEPTPQGPPLVERLRVGEIDARLAGLGFKRVSQSEFRYHWLLVYALP